MKKQTLIILSILSFSLNSFSRVEHSPLQNNWISFKKALAETIENSDALSDFWYGDDGIDCGEPSFNIKEIDFKTQTAELEVFQSDVKYGCIKGAFNCKASFSFNSEDLTVEPVSILNDCDI